MPPVFVWWCLSWMTSMVGIECRSAHLTDRECWAAFAAAPNYGPHEYPINCVPQRDRDSPQLRRRLGFYDRREVI